MSEAALLEVKDLTCERGYRRLFSQLNFQLRRSEVLRITGANGTGKTSLLNILAGLSSQYDGEIFFQGETARKAQAERAELMTYLAHDKAVKLNLTVLENLQWYQALYPCKALSNDDLLAVLEQLGLKAYRMHRASDLSAGQRQRIALARLLISDAKLWILDEPFTAIDQSGVKQFETIIANFAKAGGAVIITAHHALSIEANYRELELSDLQEGDN